MALLESGRQIERWLVVRFIDEGGNGEVWEVQDESGARAAMKILRDSRVDSVAYRRFRREIETLVNLGERPGVIPIIVAHLPEQPTRKNRAWYVMPLAEPMQTALEGRAVKDVIDAVAALAEVLAALHELGIGHRDIKPANLLWRDGRPALGDFGLIHRPDAESLTEPDRVPGAFGYIADEVMVSPETARAEPADVFALAKVMWKLLTPGALFPPQGPLRADGGPSTLARSLTVARADALDRILEAATRVLPGRATMHELACELRAWLALPPPANVAEGLDAVLAAARATMTPSLSARDEGTARRERADAAQQLLMHRADALFEALRTIDPTGLQVGRMAVGQLNRLVEQPAETGRPLYGPPFHYGARVTRFDGRGRDEVLVVAFCLQVAEQGPAEAALTGLLLAGDEETSASDFRMLPTERPALGMELEAAIERTVKAASEQLDSVLRSFTTSSLE